MKKMSWSILVIIKIILCVTQIVIPSGQVIKLTAGFSTEGNKYIIKSSETEQYFARSVMECAFHCLDTLDCCKSSLSKETGECIVDKTNGCSAKIGYNADTMLMEKKLDCGPGWQEYNGRCIIYTQTKMNWDDSVAFCNVNGGQLFIIRSAAENLWLKNASQLDGPFIGARKNGNGAFVWNYGRTDQFPVEQTFWQPEEPNGGAGDVSCVMIRQDTGGWNDINCNDPTQPVLCQKPRT